MTTLICIPSRLGSTRLARKPLLHIHGRPLVAHVMDRAAESGGMRGRPTVTDSGVPGVFLAGDWVGPAGHLADASLASAEAAVAAAVTLVGR